LALVKCLAFSHAVRCPCCRAAAWPLQAAEDAGRIAEAAGVKTLVLSHLVPADDPEVTEQMWIEAAQQHFRGIAILGNDLFEV
jgi:phosphoribosyl 1,2-cyclic phosphodiesterase